MFAGLASPIHLLILIFIILLFFGAKRLPEMGRSLAQGIQEFKEGINSKEEPQETEEQKRPDPLEADKENPKAQE